MFVIVLASAVPGLFWLWYFNRYDRWQKEPLLKLGQCLLFGALAVLPALSWEAPFWKLLQEPSTIARQFFLSFFVIGLGEEFFKLAAVYLAVFRSPHFDEPIDGIIYAIAAGIGFSIVENIHYILAFGLTVAPLRGTIASLAHIAFSGLAGSYLGKARFSAQPKAELGRGLALAAFLHGLYDFVLIAGLIPPLATVLLVFFLHYFLLRAISRAQRASQPR